MVRLPKALLITYTFVSLLILPICSHAQSSQAITNASLEAKLIASDASQKAEILTQLVEYYRDNEPTKSLDFAKQALEQLTRFPNHKLRVQVLNNMAWAYIAIGDYDAAQHCTDESKSIAQANNYEQGLYAAKTMQGIIYWRAADYHSALKQFEQALVLAKNQPSQHGIANTTNYIAIIYQILGEPKQALRYFQQALEIQTQLGEEKSIAVSLNNIANVYGTSGNYSLALEYQLKSLKIREKLNDFPGLAQVLGNIGLTYFFLENDDLALEYLQRSLGYYESIKDKLGVAETLTSLGTVHLRKNQYEAALHQLNLAIGLANELNDDVMLARIKIDIASVYVALNDPINAEAFAKPALTKITDLQVNPLLANALLVNAKIAKLNNTMDFAIKLVKQALKVAENVDDKRLMRDSYEFIYELHKQQNNFSDALLALEHFKRINDGMFNSQSDQRISFLMSHFEAEKREQQIKLLKTDQQLKQKELEQQHLIRYTWIAGLTGLFILTILLINRLHQRKIHHSLNQSIKSQRELIQAIAHEFRSPLAKVQLAFDMLEDQGLISANAPLSLKINNGLSELEKLIKEALDFIQLENNHDLIQLSSVKLGNLLSEVLEAHVDLYPDIDFELCEKGPQPCLIKADKHQLTRAVSNIVRNAARFATNKVKVTLINHIDSYEISIEDDGPGIPVNERLRVLEPFVRLDLSRCRDSGGVGLGLSLAKKIIELHNGTLTIAESSINGAKIALRAPSKTTKK